MVLFREISSCWRPYISIRAINILGQINIICQNTISQNCKSLTHFMPLVSFYTPWNHQKASGCVFRGSRKRSVGMKWVKTTYPLRFFLVTTRLTLTVFVTTVNFTTSPSFDASVISTMYDDIFCWMKNITSSGNELQFLAKPL